MPRYHVAHIYQSDIILPFKYQQLIGKMGNNNKAKRVKCNNNAKKRWGLLLEILVDFLNKVTFGPGLH